MRYRLIGGILLSILSLQHKERIKSLIGKLFSTSQRKREENCSTEIPKEFTDAKIIHAVNNYFSFSAHGIQIPKDYGAKGAPKFVSCRNLCSSNYDKYSKGECKQLVEAARTIFSAVKRDCDSLLKYNQKAYNNGDCSRVMDMISPLFGTYIEITEEPENKEFQVIEGENYRLQLIPQALMDLGITDPLTVQRYARSKNYHDVETQGYWMKKAMKETPDKVAYVWKDQVEYCSDLWDTDKDQYYIAGCEYVKHIINYMYGELREKCSTSTMKLHQADYDKDCPEMMDVIDKITTLLGDIPDNMKLS